MALLRQGKGGAHLSLDRWASVKHSCKSVKITIGFHAKEAGCLTAEEERAPEEGS